MADHPQDRNAVTCRRFCMIAATSPAGPSAAEAGPDALPEHAANPL
ncbi:hypothetical protein [Micromonospora sp. NBC_01813]|nr:hypothetical protein [Micromonospora sp. NBC_01813]WSA09463.1 hypothetical protein OG958_01110 [Micromonospora sp. NBC_01813]